MKPILPALILLLSVTALIACFFNIGLNADEGMYAYAGRLANDGKIPYTDFGHPQGPLFPRMLGINQLAGEAITTLIGITESPAVLDGRIGALLVTLGSVAIMWWICRTRGVKPTLAACILLMGPTSIMWACSNTSIKTHPWATLLLLATAAPLFMKNGGGWKGALLACAAGAAAACTRTPTLLIVAPMIASYWFLHRKTNRFAHWAMLGTATVFLTAIFSIPILKNPETAKFWNIDYHLANRHPKWSWTFFQSLAIAAPGTLILASISLATLRKTWKNPQPEVMALTAALFGGLTLTLWGGIYPDYLVPSLGIIIPCAGAIIARNPDTSTRVMACCLAMNMVGSTVVVATKNYGLINPPNPQWVGDLQQIQSEIKKRIDPKQPILTPRPEVLPKNYHTFPLMETGMFCVTSDMGHEPANRVKMITHQQIAQLIELQKWPVVIQTESTSSWNWGLSMPSCTIHLFPIGLQQRLPQLYEPAFQNKNYTLWIPKTTQGATQAISNAAAQPHNPAKK